MANVHTKQHLFVLVQGKNGLEKREVKQTSSHAKLTERMARKLEEGIRYNQRVEKRPN